MCLETDHVIDRVDLVDRAVEQFCQGISPVIELDVQCRILTNTQANTIALLVLCMYVTDDTMKIPIFLWHPEHKYR